MKIIFLIAACLFSVFNTASSQYYNIIWEKSLAPNFGAPDEYIGTVLQFTCMNCLDKNNCIITGIVNKYPSIQDPGEPRYKRITMRTNDGGQTWMPGLLSTDIEKSYIGVNRIPYLQSIIMIDSLIAVAVGDSGKLIRSSDGGMTWERIHNATPQQIGAGFRSVAFTPDRATGMAVGTYGIISITTDSGRTWDTKELCVYPTIYQNVVSPANNVFYIFDNVYAKMFRTFDAGKTWDTLTVYKNYMGSKPVVTADSEMQGYIYTTYFLSPAVGWISVRERHKENTDAVDIYRGLAQTIDSGRTWVKRKMEFAGFYDWFNSIAFADANNGIVGGFAGLSLFSADGGFSWYEGQRFRYENNPSVKMVQYKDPDVGFAVLAELGIYPEFGEVYRFRRVPLSVDEVQGWGSNPYFWVQTAPCPAVSTVRARLFGLYSIKTREVTAKVYDMMGNVVYDASREATDGNNGTWSDLTFSVEGWAPGVYLLGMQAEGAGFARAFVVSR